MSRVFHIWNQSFVSCLARSCLKSGTSSMPSCLYTRYKTWISCQRSSILIFVRLFTIDARESIHVVCHLLLQTGCPITFKYQLFYTLLSNKEQRIIIWKYEKHDSPKVSKMLSVRNIYWKQRFFGCKRIYWFVKNKILDWPHRVKLNYRHSFVCHIPGARRLKPRGCLLYVTCAIVTRVRLWGGK